MKNSNSVVFIGQENFRLCFTTWTVAVASLAFAPSPHCTAALPPQNISFDNRVTTESLRNQLLALIPPGTPLPAALVTLESIFQSHKTPFHRCAAGESPTRPGDVKITTSVIDPQRWASADLSSFDKHEAEAIRRIIKNGKRESLTNVRVDLATVPYALGLLKRSLSAKFVFDEHQLLIRIEALIDQGLF